MGKAEEDSNALTDESWPARFIMFQEEERYRLARDIQQGLGQLLANAVLELDNCQELMKEQPYLALEGLRSLRNELSGGLTELRRLIADLQPPLLADMGLLPSLTRYAEAYEQCFDIRVRLHLDLLKERLPATMEVAIFRIIQETLRNVQKHAQASQVEIEVTRQADKLVFTIQDNGLGFGQQGLRDQQTRSLGLASMKDRAEMLQGRLQMLSQPGHGVKVILTVPDPFA